MANALQFLSARVTSRMHAAAHRVRARYANQTAARAANTPDFGSVMALTVFVVGSTLWASYAPPPPSKARELRVSEDPAMHWFDQESASAAPRTDAPRCAGSVDSVVRTQPCALQERDAWLWAATNAQRRAMGERICWWYADAEALAQLSGITETWAERILVARDAEESGLKRLPAELTDRIGAQRVKILEAHVSTNCALMARDTANR